MTEPELDPEKEHQRLDDLGNRIAETRREVDDLDPATENEQAYVDSGTIGPDEDDQNAAPL